MLYLYIKEAETIEGIVDVEQTDSRVSRTGVTDFSAVADPITKEVNPMTTQHILVPMDFSAYADHALDYAIALAEKLQARLTLLQPLGQETKQPDGKFRTSAAFPSKLGGSISRAKQPSR